MKRVILFASLLLWGALVGASGGEPQDAGWLRLSNGLFAAKSLEGKRFYLMAHNHAETNQLSIKLNNDESSLCKGVADTAAKSIGSVGVYKVGGTPVKFSAACIGRNQIEYPTSPAGQKLLNEAVDSGDKLRMEVGAGDRITFDLSGFPSVRKALAEMRGAL